MEELDAEDCVNVHEDDKKDADVAKRGHRDEDRGDETVEASAHLHETEEP